MRGRIGSGRVRALFRIAREGQELAAVGQDPRGHVLQELARTMNAAVGIVAVGSIVRQGKIQIDDMLSFGWRTQSEENRVMGVYLERPPEFDPVLSNLLDTPGEVVTRNTDDVAPCAWIHHDVHRPASLQASLVSLRRLDERSSRVVVLKRPFGDGPFDDEDCDSVDVFRAEHEALLATAAVPPTHLSRREREVFDLLMTGLSEKLIAASLGVSTHTAHDYVKVLYRKLRVRSRAELMARHRPVLGRVLAKS